MRKICDFIIRYSIYGLVLLIPLFFLPWTGELFEFNKQYLLVFLVSLALLAWLIKTVSLEGRLFFKRSPLDLPIFIFAILTVLSAVFSVDKISSWMGFYGRFTDGVVVLLFVLIMYFLLINNVTGGSEEKQRSIAKKASLDVIINLFLISSLVVVLVAYFSLFGVWGNISGMPQIMNLQSFNTISGSFEGLSIFLTAVIALLVGLFLKKDKSNSGGKKSIVGSIGRVFLFVAVLIMLIFIDFGPAWVVLIVTMSVLLIMAFWTRLFGKNVNVLLIPIVLLFISAAGLYINARGVILDALFLDNVSLKESLGQLPQEVILDSETSESVIWQTVKEKPLLGSGPGTFLISFAKYKPAGFNETRFWNVRFDKATDHILEMIGAIGILGSLAYLLFIVIFLLMVGVVLFNKKKLSELSAKYPISDNRHPVAIFPFILVWLALFVGQFVYLQNMVFVFYFWLFTALTMAAWQTAQNKPFKEVDYSFDKLPEIGLVLNILVIILAFGLISLFYISGRFYWADVKFNQPVFGDENLLINTEKAVTLNKYRPEYRRALSQIYLQSAWLETQKSEEEMNLQILENYARGSIEQAKAATNLAPNRASSWENLGSVYRDAQGLIEGTAPLAIDSFARAVELEPSNPFFYREICRLNIVSEENDLDKALEYCTKAVDLKPNYLDAHLQLALVYEKKGDSEKALEKLEGALDRIKGISFQRGSDLAGAAAEIYFQIGRVQFNLERPDKALTMFEQAIVVMPEHANANYAAALIYQTEGRSEEALRLFRIVDFLSPGNENVQMTIKQLEAQLQPEEPASASETGQP